MPLQDPSGGGMIKGLGNCIFLTGIEFVNLGIGEGLALKV